MSDEPKNAKDRVRRFLRFFLSLEEPEFFFHQTLTFADRTIDDREANARLKRLLEQKICRGAVWVRERQEQKGLHFHVLLYFYAQNVLPFSPSKMAEGVRAGVFKAWQELNGGTLVQAANVLTGMKPSFETVRYLVKTSRNAGIRGAGESNWWGKRNAQLLQRRAGGAPEGEVRDFMQRLYPRCWPVFASYTKRDFDRQKKLCLEVSLNGLHEWEEHKRREVGVSHPISDADYLRAMKERARAKRRPINHRPESNGPK